MLKRLANTLENERGMVFVVAVLMLSVVGIIGIAALATSTTEIQISSNEKLVAVQFYNAEAGLIDTMEQRPTWMTTDFLTQPPAVASYATNVDADDDGDNDAAVDLKCVQDTDATAAANNKLPVQRHRANPPAGSGYSLKYFEIRRYGVTATSQDGNTQLQTGFYKVFNKF